MTFDAQAFLDAAFQSRREKVNVPEMADFFGADPAIIVRGLTGHEMAKADLAHERYKQTEQIAEALGSGKVGEALKTALGVGGETPPIIAKRLEMLVIGAVEPAVDLPVAVKICTYFPEVFFRVTNVINGLTGMGGVVDSGESQPSGTTQG